MFCPVLRFMVFGICLLAAVPMIEATEAPRSLTIFYTSNVQGNLDPCGCAKEQLGDIPTRATVLRSLRAREKNVLVVDSGNAFSDGSLFNTFDRARRDLIVEAMSHMGYNYLNVGDTELGFNRSILQEIQEKARFMLLSANILDRTRREPVFSPYALHNVGGLKVALIGLVTDRPSKRIPPEHTRDLLFADPIIAAREYVSVLKEQSDLLVVVAHLGLEREKELAQAVPQIDVIIGGHSGELRKTPLKVGKTLILAGGEQGQYVGKLSLKLNTARAVVSYEHELVPVDARHFPADRHIQTLWQAYKEQERKGEIYDRRDRRKSLTFSLEGPPFEGKE